MVSTLAAAGVARAAATGAGAADVPLLVGNDDAEPIGPIHIAHTTQLVITSILM